MEETLPQTHNRWSYGLLKNAVCIAPGRARSSVEMGNEQALLIRAQGMSVHLFARGEPVALAPYLVYQSPDSEEIPEREYKGIIDGYSFGVYRCDADIDIDLIQPDGTVWRGICNYEPESE